MSLNKLLENIPSSNKTSLLGDKTTKLLRFSFANNKDILEDSVLNQALALQRGNDFYHSKKLRELLIGFIPNEDLNRYGVQSHKELKELVLDDKKKFANTFNIEDEYCLEKPVDSRQAITITNPVYGESNGTKSYPHPYQYSLKKILVESLFHEFSPKILLTLPTGAGKTVLAMEAIIDLLRIKKSSDTPQILWLVSTKELVEQSLNSFLEYWKQKGDHQVAARRYYGKFDNLEKLDYSSITFATYDLLINRLDDEGVKDYFANCDYLFIDEAHYSQAETYKEVLKLYRTVNNHNRIIALTATPFRNDSDEFKSFKKNFKSLLSLNDAVDLSSAASPIEYLQAGGYLSQIITTKFYKKYSQQKDKEYYNELHSRIFEICDKLNSNNQNIIIFAESKSHAIALAIFLKKNSIENGLIVGETPDILRKELLNKFGDKDNKLNVLINHGILATGIDVPGMNAIMILREIESPSLALQIIGRAMRGPENGGNELNYVYLTENNFDYLSRYKIIEDIVLS